VEQGDKEDHATKVQTASLLLDETWKLYNAHRTEFESDRNFKFEQTKYKEAKAAANREAGRDIYANTTDRISANTRANQAATSKERLALDRAKEQRQGAKSKAEVRQADANIRLRTAELKLSQQKAKGGGSDAQKAERDLAIDILKDSEAIIGKPKKYGKGRDGGMTYGEAYNYIYALAEQTMTGRNAAYINSWVRARLKTLGLSKVPPKRSGR
jgi:hypothetical protein